MTDATGSSDPGSPGAAEPGAAERLPRPRPQYGEYATPEEQRSRIQQPDPALLPPVEPVPVAPQSVELDPAGSPPAPATATARPPLRPDRVITAILLGMGAVNVFVSAQSFFDLADAFTRTMASMEIPGEFTNFAAARTWGAIAAVSLVVGYLATAYAAWRRLRAGRISWWIPVVGAILTYIVILVCLAVPLTGDPAFQQYVMSLS